MRQQTITVYNYNELPDSTQEYLYQIEVENIIQYRLEHAYENEDKWAIKAIQEGEAKQTPWFEGQILWELDRNSIKTEAMDVLMNQEFVFRNDKFTYVTER